MNQVLQGSALALNPIEGSGRAGALHPFGYSQIPWEGHPSGPPNLTPLSGAVLPHSMPIYHSTSYIPGLSTEHKSHFRPGSVKQV